MKIKTTEEIVLGVGTVTVDSEEAEVVASAVGIRGVSGEGEVSEIDAVLGIEEVLEIGETLGTGVVEAVSEEAEVDLGVTGEVSENHSIGIIIRGDLESRLMVHPEVDLGEAAVDVGDLIRIIVLENRHHHKIRKSLLMNKSFLRNML